MCNFNKQSEDAKAFLNLFMTKAAQNIGGANFLLALIEAMKLKKPNSLIYKECRISSNNTTIKWNKVVFADKLRVLEEVFLIYRDSQNSDFNILSDLNKKNKKNVMNMVKTLLPIEFIVIPQNHNDGGGFNFKVFETIEDDFIKINPIFIAMFFCSTEFTKKALKYKI